MTSAVKGDSPASLVITTTSSSSRSLASRETSTQPELVVEPPPPLPPPPLASDDSQPRVPIRAAFHYPWFPGAWTQKGIYPYTHYHPSLGFYDSRDPAVIQSQVRAMQYGNIEAGILSWWGQGSREDRKVPAILANTPAAGGTFRWGFYYEKEGNGPDPTVDQLKSDLTYLTLSYGFDPSVLRLNGRLVVFVYADAGDGCGMADRWKQANAGIGAYIVLKVFSGYRTCASQPDSWHQYSPAVAADRQAGYSYSISPGFWLADGPVRLSRDLSRWRQNVRDMIAAGDPWQLVTTFNEWGEGTSVESAEEWETPSGYGSYLDALHADGQNP